MATVTLVSGSPENIAELEKTIATFEKVNSIKYSRKEKLNACAYVFYYDPGVDPDLDFNEILTKRYRELFITIVNDESAILLNEGSRYEYPGS